MSHSKAAQVTAAADSAIARAGLLNNPYLAALAEGRMSLERFRSSQEQFFFAVRYFSRPMAALLSRMADPMQHLDLLHNIVEEHGDFRPEAFHQNTFRIFLQRIGAADPLTQRIAMNPAVHAFNNTLMAACVHDPVDVGIACLGVIEHAFANISARIGEAAVRSGWVKSTEMVHYTLHAELDTRHAEEFFVLVEPAMADAGRRSDVEQGLALGAYAFDQLYRNL